MSGETVPLREHLEAIRRADLLFLGERDRRLTEVAVEREKALKIKETADLAALQLAREIQTYKDEKANELREQINSERGLYATKADLVAAAEKFEATVKPIAEFVFNERGIGSGVQASWLVIVAVVSAAIGVTGIVLALLK